MVTATQFAKFLLSVRSLDGEIDWDKITELASQRASSKSSESGSSSKDRPQCTGRRQGDELEGFTPKVFEEKQCVKKAMKDGDLCKVCQKNFDAKNKSWHGIWGEEIAEDSHIKGSAWFFRKFPDGEPAEKKADKKSAEDKPEKAPKKAKKSDETDEKPAKKTAKKSDASDDSDEKPVPKATKKSDESDETDEKPSPKATKKSDESAPKKLKKPAASKTDAKLEEKLAKDGFKLVKPEDVKMAMRLSTRRCYTVSEDGTVDLDDYQGALEDDGTLNRLCAEEDDDDDEEDGEEEGEESDSE
jgi:hypothetical protein